MYYLQSRYYNASIGSFVNVDGCEIIKEISWINKNLFAYCNCDPVNNEDSLGMSATLVIGGVALTVGQLVALVACVAFLYFYLFDARFRDAINQLIYGICMMIANGLRYLSNVITDAIAKARSSRQYRGTEDHHIVARSDSRAGYSRKMINRHLIFTWHPVNIVTISKTLHKHLHTNAYFAAIDLCVASVIYMNNTWSDKRLHLIALLLTISVILKTASKFI